MTQDAVVVRALMLAGLCTLSTSCLPWRCGDVEDAREASPQGAVVATATTRNCGLPGDEILVRAYLQRGKGERNEILRLVAPVKMRFAWDGDDRLRVIVTDIFGDKPESWPEIEKLIGKDRTQTVEGVSVNIGTTRQFAPSAQPLQP